MIPSGGGFYYHQSHIVDSLHMRKTIGIVLTTGGLVSTVITGIQVMQESDSFSFFGLDVVVSKANYTPLIVSVAVLVVGIVLWANSRRNA